MFGAGRKRGLQFSTTVAWSSFDGVDLYRVILQHHLNRRWSFWNQKLGAHLQFLLRMSDFHSLHASHKGGGRCIKTRLFQATPVQSERLPSAAQQCNALAPSDRSETEIPSNQDSRFVGSPSQSVFSKNVGDLCNSWRRTA